MNMIGPKQCISLLYHVINNTECIEANTAVNMGWMDIIKFYNALTIITTIHDFPWKWYMTL